MSTGTDAHETRQWITGCICAVIAVAIVIGGPTACAIELGEQGNRKAANYQEQATARVTAACNGDLKTDAVRATACLAAVNDAGTPRRPGT